MRSDDSIVLLCQLKRGSHIPDQVKDGTRHNFSNKTIGAG